MIERWSNRKTPPPTLITIVGAWVSVNANKCKKNQNTNQNTFFPMEKHNLLERLFFRNGKNWRSHMRKELWVPGRRSTTELSKTSRAPLCITWCGIWEKGLRTGSLYPYRHHVLELSGGELYVFQQYSNYGSWAPQGLWEPFSNFVTHENC